MRKPFIAANWKMHKTASEAEAYLKSLVPSVKDVKHDLVVFPAATALSGAASSVKDSTVSIGAQNFYYEEDGAFTGEISAAMVKEFATYALVGHSERRQLFGDTDDMSNQKIVAALKHGIIPVLCIGETIWQREGEMAEEVVQGQLNKAFKGVSKEDIQKVIVAYEPIWAIGTDKAESPEDAEEMLSFIRKSLASDFGQDVADAVRIIYGGSVDSKNVKDLVALTDCDGVLVGHSSLDQEEFAKIAKFDS